jgi:anti-repressor protein
MLAQGVNDSFSLDDEQSMFNIGRQGDTTIVNESGLYSLILGSRKPEAKKFKKWVTSEVLPAIRKKAKSLIDIDGINHPVQQNQQLDEKRRAQKKPVLPGLVGKF